jgi:ribose transport system substrate-binding protein
MAQDVIGYITKSATNAGWMMINQGAADAAAEEGVKLVAVGPSFQGDLSSQLEVFENLVAQGAKAIGVAPVDSAGIAPAVTEAMGAGIPVIAIDTNVSGADVTSFVATDNLAVAKVQGAVAATLIEDGDVIIYVTGNQAQSTGQERRNGFMSAFQAARPNSEVLEVPTQWNSQQAQEGVEAVLNARNDVKMIVNAWDGGTMGAKAALENLGYGAGDVKLVGFDGASDAIVAMDQGWVHADTAQMLYQMGYQGIKAAAAAARGEAVAPRIDTGFFLVTPSTAGVYKKMVGIE